MNTAHIGTITYSSDAFRFDAETQLAKVKMVEVLLDTFGERCPDCHDSCPKCERWRAFDVLFENPFK